MGLSHWANADRRAAYDAAYDASLGLWPIPYQHRDVDTAFGTTRVVTSGAEDGESIVLLHAASLSATQWYLQAADLGAVGRLYAADLMGDIGRSVQARAIHTRQDGADWLAGLLDGLGIERAVLVGSSFGGFHATNLAVLRPDRVRALVLLAPAATIRPFKLLANVMIRAGSLWPLPRTVKPGLRGMMQGSLPEARIVRQMELGVAGFRYDRRGLYPSQIGDDELAALGCPALLLVGDREMIYGAREAVDRAHALIGGVEAEIVPGVGHLLGMQRPDLVNARILTFLATRMTGDRS
jgi:pimeloyl-ACP methyl ester carboxylesterase